MPLCQHGSQEVGLTAWPAPWLKKIKSYVEIGHSLAVTENSDTNMGTVNFHFPLLLLPYTNTYYSQGLWDECYTTHTLLILVGETEDMTQTGREGGEGGGLTTMVGGGGVELGKWGGGGVNKLKGISVQEKSLL